MQSVGFRGRGAASTGLLIALVVFGVLLMHSVTPVMSAASGAMVGDHHSMVASDAVDGSVPVAFGEHDCPSAHQMMHPCMGTTVSWSALTDPVTSGEIHLSPLSTEWRHMRVDSTQERAPPWTLWELDKSVTLRV
ncbi:DUF6153 family protein [Rhodococcoides fascians]|uniref:DUF6153 family protein n=1 Tax=Rhodococcoides fascians TaxID=1828 RepID=UPI0005604C16|nr:DUF6153 family protein [Rhodococcus fascians]